MSYIYNIYRERDVYTYTSINIVLHVSQTNNTYIHMYKFIEAQREIRSTEVRAYDDRA